MLLKAEQLKIDTSRYGILSVNDGDGRVMLWVEDYAFTLAMPIICELEKEHIVAIWTNPLNGKEREMRLKPETSLDDICEWAQMQFDISDEGLE